MKLDSQKQNRSLFYLFLALIGIAFYFFNLYTPMFCDDFWYATKWKQLGRITSFEEIIQFQKAHYFEVNGRFMTHFIDQLFLLYDAKWLFNVVNALVFVAYLLFATHLLSIRSAKNALFGASLVFALSVFFLPDIGETVLWQTGSLNYLWGVVAAMGILLLYEKQKEWTKPTKWYWHLGLFILALLSAWFHEATSVGIAGAFVIMPMIDKSYRTTKNYTLALTIGFCIGSLLVALSPGILMRFLGSVVNRPSLLFKIGLVTLGILAQWRLLLLLSLILVVGIGLFRKRFQALGEDLFVVVAFTISCLFLLLVGVPNVRSSFAVSVWGVLLLARLIFTKFVSKNQSPLQITTALLMLSTLPLLIPAFFNLKSYKIAADDLYKRIEQSTDGVFYRNEKLAEKYMTVGSEYPIYNFLGISHNPDEFVNHYVASYFYKPSVIGLSREMYDNLYLNDNFCIPKNRVNDSIPLYYDSTLPYFIVKLSDGDARDGLSKIILKGNTVMNKKHTWYRAFYVKIDSNYYGGKYSQISFVEEISLSDVTHLTTLRGDKYLLIDQRIDDVRGIMSITFE